ncbi:MAG: nicotinate-nucleotide diphosphorylase [Phycisphaerales bacterium]
MEPASGVARRPDLEAIFARLTESGLVRRLIQLAAEEDLGERWSDGPSADITSRACIAGEAPATAAIVARESGVLAGVRVVPQVLQAMAPDVLFQARAADGHPVSQGQHIGLLAGPARQVLAAERTLLNFLGRLSGVATLTSRFVSEATHAARHAGLPRAPAILDTRKTTPGLRALEKYAVACGGGGCHRIGLYDAVLIKDNHLAGVALADLPAFLTAASAKARAIALERTRALTPAHPSGDPRPPVAAMFLPNPPRGGGPSPLAFVEAEVDTLEQFAAIIGAGGCGLDIILLDNFTPDLLRRAVKMRNSGGLPILLEASGGVSLDTVGFVAATGVDRISAGQLTHSARCLDVALDFIPPVA